ncbi:MAG: hypothetical protein ACO3A2_08945 [Bdellovibrionia bacterium]
MRDASPSIQASLGNGKQQASLIQKVRSKTWFFLKDDTAQATTEYIMLLSISVGIFLTLRKILQPVMTRLVKGLSAQITQTFSSNLHHFRIPR